MPQKKFKVYKDVKHRDGSTSKQWVPTGKSIANLYQYAELSKATTMHFLDSIHNIVPQQSLESEINEVCEKKTIKGNTVTGFNVWCPSLFLLFETLCEGTYLIRGFTNQDI